MNIELEQFSPGNESLKYLKRRIQNENYRGEVSSQHNRWTFDDLVFVLERLHEVKGDSDYLRIRTTDKSKRPQNVGEEFDFARFCSEVAAKLGKGTQDAMRKNWFVDWHRCGWIERFDKNLKAIGEFDRGIVQYVRISVEGMKLLSGERTRADKFYVFSKGIDKLYLGTIGVLLDLVRDFDIKHVDLHEFSFFVSAIDSREDFALSRSEAAELIKSWRTLTPMTRQQIDSYLGKVLDPKNNPHLPKNEKRDFHNWINKTQQTFSLLKQTVYFELVAHLQSPHLSRLYYLGDNAAAGAEFANRDASRLNRSLQQKHNYFQEHGVTKMPGFELHHIVALAWSESLHEFKMLDDWRNMIYIDGFSHAKITQNRNLNVQMRKVGDSTVSLSDFSGNVVELVKPSNTLLDERKLPLMLAYNKELLEGKTNIAN